MLIHRALFGSSSGSSASSRNYAGAFPAFGASAVVSFPVADDHVDYLSDVAAELRRAGVRAEGRLQR